MPRKTGFPAADAADDFLRAPRRQMLRRLSRGFGGDVDVILPFDEVIAELGRIGEREVGLEGGAPRGHRRHRGPRARVRPRLPADLF